MPAAFNSNSERQETDGKLFHRRRVWLAALKSAWIKAACIECPEVVLTGASERWCWHPLKCSDCGTHIGATCSFFSIWSLCCSRDSCVFDLREASLETNPETSPQTNRLYFLRTTSEWTNWHWTQPLNCNVFQHGDKLCEPVHAAVQLKCLSAQKGMITIVAKWRQKEWILVSLWV